MDGSIVLGRKPCTKCREEKPATKEFFVWSSARGVSNRCRACQTKWHREERDRRAALRPPRPTALERFHAKTARCENGCIEWTARKNLGGYGQFSTSRGRWLPAHRFLWIATHGPIPDGLFVCHRCDNRACVNIEHLFLGTPEDNMRDMAAKGRTPTVLDETSARAVLSLRSSGRPAYSVAGDFGISTTVVQRIWAGKSWHWLR